MKSQHHVSLVNPCFFYAAYDRPLATTTLQDVRLELAKEEAADAARGVVSPHEIVLATFVTMGLDLEEQQ
jgi:hypothetical protein